MRKLKLQMQISLDGFVSAKYGGTFFNWDDEVRSFCIENLADVDCILLGSKTAENLIPYWAGVANNAEDPDYELGKRITEIPKAVFSNNLKDSKWDNASIVGGNIITEINKLKNKRGNNILVYGGYSFASSLIKDGLVDEFNLLLNPLAVGDGEVIIKDLNKNLLLTLKKYIPFACGTILLSYVERKK